MIGTFKQAEDHYNNLCRENRLNPVISGRKLNAHQQRRRSHWINSDKKLMNKYFGLDKI